MNISEVAQKTGMTAKTLRYYESIGLVVPRREDNGYRSYNDQHAKELIFLRRARQFGFSIRDCEKLVGLLRDPDRRSHEVHQLAGEKLAEMDHRLKELRAMRAELADLLQSCPDNDQPQCPIIDNLANNHDSEARASDRPAVSVTLEKPQAGDRYE